MWDTIPVQMRSVFACRCFIAVLKYSPKLRAAEESSDVSRNEMIIVERLITTSETKVEEQTDPNRKERVKNVAEVITPV